MIKVLVFDLDDTLYPERQFVLGGFRAVDNWLAAILGVEGFYETAEQFFLSGKRGNIFNLVLKDMGVDDSPKVIAALVEVYRNHKPELTLFEDARWAIDYFIGQLKLGIITDGFFVTQRNKVAALGVDGNFDKVIYSDVYGREFWKPSKIPYLKIMDALKVSGEQCTYIADNPSKDFITAKRLGWQTIQICRVGGEYSHLVAAPGYEANLVIDSLYELESLIV